MERTRKIAFYGKGGIGKSTVASNVSAALGEMGKKVLHIGCDPKADSTRCLAGRRIPTVLGQLEALGEEVRREDLIFPGLYGVSCMESGGPRVGVGCAGMGITSMAETLMGLRILDENWDVIVYDVLGDVVCGGFSVPMRRHMADAVYVVTSSDFMSLYAANNILSAAISYSGEGESLFQGFIWNHWKEGWDETVARSFCEGTRGRLLCRVAESQEIKESDWKRDLLLKEHPDSGAAEAIRQLAKRIIEEESTALSPAAYSVEELEAWMERLYQESRQ